MSETQTTDPSVTILEPEKKEAPTTQTPPTDTTPKDTPKPTSEAKVEPKAKSLLNEPEKEGDKPKVEGVPEKYEPWKLPEGFTMDEAVSTKVNDTFKELGISQEAGQKLVDLYAEQIQGAINAPVESYLDLRKGWRDEVAKDPEIGKIMPEVKQTISRALDGLGQPELATAFKEAMDLTGAGDHPAFVKAFYYLAQKAVEGKHVSGKGPTDQGKPKTPTTPAQAMYPNLPSSAQS